MTRKPLVVLKSLGIGGVLRAAYRRVLPNRLKYLPHCKQAFDSRVGLEVGGPSPIFTARGCIPVYPLAARIDNCNFGAETLWEGKVHEGDTFTFDAAKQPGRQYVADAGNLQFLPDAQYDFVLSSHCIEHLANPLQALAEWVRVLKQNGLLVLVVPHKDGTFDHRRPVTPMAHLIQDFDAQMTERDLTHLEEILKLHDLGRDPEAGGPEAFAERSRKNFENRCLHHHVFDARLAVEVVNHVRLQILAVEMFRPYHIIVIARKAGPGTPVDNNAFRGIGRIPAWTSPFPTDRVSYH
jgi:SAM-dependent methyltransferase